MENTLTPKQKTELMETLAQQMPKIVQLSIDRKDDFKDKSISVLSVAFAYGFALGRFDKEYEAPKKK